MKPMKQNIALHTLIYLKSIFYQGEDEDVVIKDSVDFSQKVIYEQDENFMMFKPLQDEKYKGNPSQRSHHTITFAHNSVIVYGGYNGVDYLSDIHQFHLTTQSWEELTPKYSDPNLKLARCGHTSLSLDEKILIFGGFSSLHHNDLLSFNIFEKKWTQLETKNSPSKRWCHTAVFDDSNQKMYIFGGYGESKLGNTKLYLNDVYCLDLETLTWDYIDAVNSDIIEKRNNHSAVIYRQNMFVFAGSKLNDLCCLDLKTKEWRKVKTWGDEPGKVYGHTACVKEHQMYVFGGRYETYKNDLYRCDLRRGKWTKMNTYGELPNERRNHGASLNIYTKDLYIFGGYGGDYIDDFYCMKLNVRPTKLTIIKALHNDEFSDVSFQF
eukprot:gene12469-6219_t